MLHFIFSLLVALVVYAIGSMFDKSPNNKNAGIAALVVFVLVLLGFTNVS